MYLVKNKKSPYYQLIYFIDGKRTSVSTGTANKNDAYKFLNSFNPYIRKHKISVKPVEEKIESLSLFNFFEEYKTYITNNYSDKYLKKAVIPSFTALKKFLKDIKLKDISPKDIDQFISHTSAKSKHSASLYYRTIKASFNKAIIWNYINENPFNKIKPPKVSKTYPAFINFNELVLIINKTEKKILKPLFYAAFFTGMRLSELVNMKWSWIDFQKNIITVKCDETFTTKSKKERIIPINSALKNILINHQPKIKDINKIDYVFYKKFGLRLNEDFVSKQFKKGVRAAKLNDKIHFHSLRHSFCSNLVQKGVSLYIVKDLAGHADLRTAQGYSHLLPENLHNAVNLL